MTTKTAAKIGANIEAVDTTTAVPVSTVDTTGFAKPPVVAVDVNLPVAFAPFIAAAVPPPAIIANDHVITGSRFATVETITAVPAIAANGIAILSKALSTHGIKYANTSATVATPKVITAAKLPIHCQLSFKSQTPKYEARLNANKGRNTLKPVEAARPIPKNILMIVSGVIFETIYTKIGYSSPTKKSSLNPIR